MAAHSSIFIRSITRREETLFMVHFGQISDDMVEPRVVVGDAARRNVLLHQSIEKGALLPGEAYPLSVPDHGPQSLAFAWLEPTPGRQPRCRKAADLAFFPGQQDPARRRSSSYALHVRKRVQRPATGTPDEHPVRHRLPDEAGLHGSPVLHGQSRAAPEIRAPLGFPRALALRHVTNYIFSRFSMHRIAVFSRILEGS